MRHGHNREAILGTGLFYESLRPHFRGRPVLPYFDDGGRPAFAIARDVGHPDDHKAGEAKYLKAIRQQDYSTVTEPIYGTETVREGEPVLVTEGIADAITAHQAGYPCLSPVTTTFKHDDRERLLDVLNDHDVSRVYVIQDAEPPGSDLDENGRLTLTQFGEGTRGGVTTAAFLAEHGRIDARIGSLPRAGLDKVDLDDYLLGWAGGDGLAPILASAKPASELVERLAVVVTEIARFLTVLEIGADDATPECFELRLCVRWHTADDGAHGCKDPLYIRPLAGAVGVHRYWVCPRFC